MYEPNNALARKISKSLREAGLVVGRGLNESRITVRAPEDARIAIVMDVMKKSDSGFDVSMWKMSNSRASENEQRTLLRAIAALLRSSGLQVDVTP